jgi:sulfide:quinone oxidoreductase
MAKIVVLGAGTGGMPAAYETKEMLGAEHEVVVINEHPEFRFVPSNPWIGVGWRKPHAVTLPLAKYLRKKDIGFICARVTAINAKHLDHRQWRVNIV